MSGDVTVVSGVWVAAESAVVGYVQPQSYDRRVKLMSIIGPGATTLRIYEGYRQIPALSRTSVFPADSRTYDSAVSGAITIPAGAAMTFAWTGGSAGVGQTATATVTSDVG